MCVTWPYRTCGVAAFKCTSQSKVRGMRFCWIFTWGFDLVDFQALKNGKQSSSTHRMLYDDTITSQLSSEDL
eukprot:6455307-Amphidinium_carterae.2